MSYAIGNIVCGCPLPEGLAKFLHENEFKPGDIKFEGLYSANGPNTVGYCGVLVKTISEGSDVDLLGTS